MLCDDLDDAPSVSVCLRVVPTHHSHRVDQVVGSQLKDGSAARKHLVDH